MNTLYGIIHRKSCCKFLVNNQEKELPELPKGAAFKIEETDVLNGYTVSFKVNDENPILQANKTFEGTLSADTTKVVVTNTLDKVPQTSIDDGNLLLEYGIILFAGIGLISLVIFARRKNNKYCGKYSA